MRFVQQRAIGDCGIAALAIYLEASYEDVYTAMASVDRKRRGKSGIYLTQLVKAAAILGVTLRIRRKFDLGESEGLLNVIWKSGECSGVGHMVVLYHDIIIDPADGEIIDAEEFMLKHNAVGQNLLEYRK